MPQIQKDYLFVAYLVCINQMWHGIPDVVKKYGNDIFDINYNYINVTLPFDKEVMAKLKAAMDKKAAIEE